MQDAKAPVNAASGGSLAATAALLCFLSAPVSAATTGLDAICDEDAAHLETHVVEGLGIDTIDHPLTSSLTGENELAGGSGDRDDTQILRTEVRDEEILRRIFDEPVSGLGDEPAVDPETLQEADNARIEERSADIADTDSADPDTGDGLLPGVRLPDATPQDLDRYRRQMFRTDI